MAATHPAADGIALGVAHALQKRAIQSASASAAVQALQVDPVYQLLPQGLTTVKTGSMAF